MAGKIRTLVESPEFEAAKNKIGDAKRIDSALLALTWAISTNPADFEKVPGFKDIRIAKTDAVKGTPRLIVWFSIIDTDTIMLRYIEASKETPEG